MRKPWNLPDLPVYSLATYQDGIVNMNICTYVTAVSLDPKIMMVAVYQNTKTLENIENSDKAVLQILRKNQAGLVRILGKKTGITYDKFKYLHTKNLTTTWQDYIVLKDACAYMELEKISAVKTGDHDAFFFRVSRSKSQHEEVLTTGHLRELSIIA
jgi:flavin reductase (DIM6/NTAB) family NADH-FMN oxidoreductase RutF